MSPTYVFERSKRPRLCMVAALLAILVSACVSAPRESIELADVTMQQINHIETAHRDLARAYFDQLENRVNTFIDDQWVPSFLNRAVQNEEVQARLADTRLGLDIDPDELRSTLQRSGSFSDAEANIIVEALDTAKLEYRVRFSNLMFDFSEAAMKEINRVRNEWHERLRTSERTLMSALDAAYGNLRTGHITIRGYLQSVVEVREMQDRIAEEVGLLEARDALLDGILETSDRLAEGSASLNQIISEVEGDTQEAGIEPEPLDDSVLGDILERLENDPEQD